MSDLVPPPVTVPLGPQGPGGPPRRRLRIWPLPPGAAKNRTLLFGLVAVGLLFALALGYWGVYSMLNPSGSRPPLPTGGAPAGWCYTVNGTPVACDAPETLEVLDRLISIQGVPTTDGLWHYFGGDPQYEDWASWVQGTVVNYVLGVSTSERNNQLFNEIDSGTLLTLTLSSGTQMVYRFQAYTEVDPGNEKTVFEQKQPALTLVLLGTGQEKKYVISAAWVTSYRSTVVTNQPPTIGTPVAISDTETTASVMVLSSSYLRDPALGLPEGNGYFLIDFTVAYTGSDVLDTQAFNMTLVDAENQAYAPTGSAGPYGRYPQPVGLLQGGEAITATLGYLVGQLPGNSVNWVVQLRPTDVQSATFQIPFSTLSPDQAARERAVVTVTATELSPEGNLLISGSVANQSNDPLTVLASDIVLTTGTGASPLIVSDPPAPWQVTPNGQTPFRVTFLRPPTGSAIFSVLGRQFIISNIP